MMRIWCFNKSHTKLIFNCFLHMLEWYEEVWMRIVTLMKKAFLWEKVMYGDFYTLFHRYDVSFQIHPLFYIRPYKGLCVYHRMILILHQASWSQCLVIWFVQILKELTKVCASKKCRPIMKKINVTGQKSIISFFLSNAHHWAFIMNSYHRKSRKMSLIVYK